MKRIMILCLALALLLACQPTPEEQPADAVSFAAFRDSLPAHWSESLSAGVAEITIDAALTVPDVDAIDVYAAHRTVGSLDLLNRFLTFFVDTPVCTVPAQDAYGTPLKTKTELEAEMQDVRNRIDRVCENNPDFTEEERAEYVAMQNAELDALAKAYADAPDQSESVVSDPGAALSEQSYAQVRVYAENDALLRAILNLNAKGGGFTIEGMRTDNRAVSEAPVSSAAIARETADRLIAGADLSDEYVYAGSSEGTGGISVYYVRMIHGIPFSHSVVCNTEEVFNTGFSQEYIRFCFFRDGTALSELDVTGVYEIDGVETKDCSLLSFAEIAQSARGALNAHLSWQPENVLHTEMTVTGAQLGYRLIRKPNTKDSFLIVPVWSILGTVLNEIDLNGTSVTDNVRLSNDVILVMNAMDGFLIWFYQ